MQIINQKNRERERECFYLPVFKIPISSRILDRVGTNQGLDLSVFSARGGSAFGRQFNIQRGKSDAIFAADFLFFNINNPRLPYKDDAFDYEPYIDSPDYDLLEKVKVEEMNEEPPTEP